MRSQFVLQAIFLLGFCTLQAQDKWVWQNPLPQGNNLNSIVFTTPSTGYAIGDFGTILKTTDSGVSWSYQYVSTKNLRAIQFIGVDTGFAVGEGGLLIKTVNAGADWAPIATGTAKNLNAVFFVNSKYGHVAGDSLTMLGTQDGGSTWFNGHEVGNTFIDNFDFLCLYFSNTNVGVATTSSGVFQTINAGLSWSSSAYKSPSGVGNLYFADPQIGFGIGEGIFKTTDGGFRWDTLTISEIGSPGFGAMSFLNADTGFVYRGDSLISTIDGGKSWSSTVADSVLEGSNVASIYATSANSVYLVSSFGQIMKTSTTPPKWTVLSKNVLNDIIVTICFPTPKVGYAALAHSILKTVDGGATWLPFSTNSSRLYKQLFFLDSSNGYAVGWKTSDDHGFLDKTTDGGKTWVPQVIGNPWGFWSVQFPDSKTGYAFGYMAIRKTTNGGLTWDSIPVPNRPTAWDQISFVDANIGYIESQNEIYKTVNGGQSWDSVSRVNALINSINFTDKNTGYVASDKGRIFKTIDGGGKWIESVVDSSLNVFRKISFANANVGYAVGDNGTIFKTKDAGATWLREEAGTRQEFIALAFPDTNTAYTAGIYSIMKWVRGSQSAIFASKPASKGLGLGEKGEFEYKLSHQSKVIARLIDMRGKVSMNLIDGLQSAGEYKISLPSKDVLRGAYVLDFRSDDFRQAVRVLRQ